MSLNANRNISLTAPSTLYSGTTGQTLTVNGTVDGAKTLTLGGPGNITFAGVIGGNTPLTGITQNAGTGTTTFDANVTVAAGGADFPGNVALGGSGITLSSGGPVTFGTDHTNALRVTGSGPTTITTTNQDVTLNAATTVTQAQSLSFNLGSGTFTQNTGATIDMTNGGGNPAGAKLTVTADQMTLGAAINAGTGGIVTLAPATAGQVIDMGTKPGGTLGLTNAELDEVTAKQLTIGSATNTGGIVVTANITASGYPTLELLTGGAITDPGGFTLDPTNLALSAANGIGTSIAPMITAATNLVAQNTATVGIFISNTGALTIGYTGDPFQGVKDTGAAADAISLTNAGSLTITTLGEIVVGPGEVTVTTTSGDILLGGNNGAGFDSFSGAVASSGGTATLDAAGNLLDGDTASGGSYGDIEGGGSIVLEAGGNINVDENSIVSAHGTGTITATAGGNISLLDTTGTHPAAVLATQGGAITLTTGAGGTLTVDSDSAAEAEPTIFTTRNGGNGNITINADHFILNAGTDSITAGTGIVTIQQVTGTEAIQLGTTTDAELDLSDAELGAITAGTLRIGATANTGNITVTAAVSTPNVPTLSLLTGGSVSQTAGALTVTNLAVQGAGGVDLAANPNTVTTLAASAGPESFDFTNTPSLTVGTVDGVIGIKAGSFADLLLEGAQSLLTVNQAIMADDNIFLTADQMTFNAAVNAGVNLVFLSTESASQPIMLVTGAKPANTLALTQSDLDEVTAGDHLELNATGSLTVAAPITSVGTGWSTLLLEAATDIQDTTAGAAPSVTTTSLGLQANTGIGGSTAAGLKTAVTNLAFQNSVSGAVTLTNTGR